jgi:hypothetical protein
VSLEEGGVLDSWKPEDLARCAGSQGLRLNTMCRK